MRTKIDWEAVRAALARTAQETEEAQAPSPQTTALLLERRARALARPLTAPPPDGATLELITFRLADERYALEVRHVREIVRAPRWSSLPGGPELLRGVAALHGELLPVADLRPLFGLAAAAAQEQARLLVLASPGQPALGLLADAVHELAEVRAALLRPPPATVSQAARPLIRGLAPEALIVLDGEVLLADPRLSIPSDRQGLA